jgi:hypothetical protein
MGVIELKMRLAADLNVLALFGQFANFFNSLPLHLCHAPVLLNLALLVAFA